MSNATRVWASSAAIVLAIGMLAGCAGGTSAEPTTAPPSSSAPPTIEPAPSAPGDDLEAWAETVIPENALGGSSAVIREVGSIAAGEDVVIDVSQPEGLWELHIGCETQDGSALGFTLTLTGDAATGLDELPCFDPTGESVAGAAVVAFDGGIDASVTLTAESDARFVYEVQPGTPADS